MFLMAAELFSIFSTFNCRTSVVQSSGHITDHVLQHAEVLRDSAVVIAYGTVGEFSWLCCCDSQAENKQSAPTENMCFTRTEVRLVIINLKSVVHTRTVLYHCYSIQIVLQSVDWYGRTIQISLVEDSFVFKVLRVALCLIGERALLRYAQRRNADH